MNKKFIVGFVVLAAAGASVFALSRGGPGPAETPPATAPEITAAASPSPTAEYKPCYFVWATQELPEVSEEFEAAVQDVLPEAEARANAYGENCVAEDGSFTFGALETDFYIKLAVGSLTEEGLLGEMVGQVLAIVIEEFPRPTVPGGQDGFVEFTFTAGDETHILRAPIPLAKELLEQGLRGAELWRALEKQ